METNRRTLLASAATTLAAGIAGCNALGESDAETEAETPTGTPKAEGGPGEAAASVDVAVAAEWNAMRAQVGDALSVARGGDTDTGAALIRRTFERFEGATGEYGAHEMLEATSEKNYSAFEEALGELRTEGLQTGDIARAREEAAIADTELTEAQRRLVGEKTAHVLALQSLGAAAYDATLLAVAGRFETAEATAESLKERFETAPVHDALQEADGDAYETFEDALEAVASAAEREDSEAVRTKVEEAATAALAGSYALADSEATASAGHIATLQARGWDAAALVSMGGPAKAFAHAASLCVYRARAADCRWLAARGETDRAATMAGDILAHFEGARAHEPLEETAHDAYEAFEAGLVELQSAIEADDSAAIETALGTVDSNLRTGIETFAGPNAALLEAAFFRARLADARERYRQGHHEAATSIAEGLFERFERNELDFHEAVEATSEALYERFEDRHLAGLIDAFENGDDEAVQTHYKGVHETLLEFETAAGTTATTSGAEGSYMAARAFDAAALDALGDDERAAAIAEDAFGHFEADPGGYHEALEEADESVYEAFENRLGAVATAAEDGEDVSPLAKQFNDEAVASVYAIVESAGGSETDAAVTLLQDTFAHFENARVHETLEATDHNAYETFEATLDGYLTALRDGDDVQAAAASFADAAQYAQFALVDAAEKLPLELELELAGDDGSKTEAEEASNLQGGPNVVESVPENADHVVDMTAIAFEPKELTVSEGDTVAWTHAAGEPHSVTALQSDLPEGAAYWASGGFDAEEAARTGWENKKGAVQSGQSFVYTFETTGTHEYVCIPHEDAGMVGTIIVE